MKNLFHGNKGQVLVLVALMLVVLLAMAGVALEIGMAYGVKARLNAAVDGAALAAGRAISPDTTAAKERAKNFFNANCPSGLLGATIYEPTTTAIQRGDGSWTIAVEATADVPTKFARFIGWPAFTVAAKSETTVRTLDLVLVLDTSLSLGTPSTTLDLLKDASKSFVGNFNASSNRIALIHFASGAVVDVPISRTTATFDKQSVINAIDALTVKGGTTAEEAIRLAKVELDAVPSTSQSSLRAIIFFTDGAPNGTVAKYNNGAAAVTGALYSEVDTSIGVASMVNGTPFRVYELGRQDDQNSNCADDHVRGYCKSIGTLPEKDHSNTISLESYKGLRTLSRSGGNIQNTWCNVNKAARNMTENIANDARSETGTPIYVFTIGLGMTTPEVTFCGYGSNESGENILRRLANVKGADTYDSNQPTGMYSWASNDNDLQAAFSRVANMLLRISK